MEAAKVIAGLTRIVRDVGLAEDLAQEALLAALQQWPTSGIPTNPGAWLMAAAKHRAIDHFRHSARTGRKHEEIGRELLPVSRRRQIWPPLSTTTSATTSCAWSLFPATPCCQAKPAPLSPCG